MNLARSWLTVPCCDEVEGAAYGYVKAKGLGVDDADLELGTQQAE